jgi:RHS repeat-associated protein
LTLTYGYDQNGNVVSVQDSLGGDLTSTYDANNQLLTREFSGTGQTPMRLDLTYTPDGQTATETYSSNLAGTQVFGVATSGYDPSGNLTSLVDTNGSGTVIASYTYTYDSANLLKKEIDSGTETDYTYDPANQLLTAGNQTQTYDANGNRTDTGYQTGAGNELLTDGTWNYSYDANGNLIQKSTIYPDGPVVKYVYDDANRLISASQTSFGNPSSDYTETLSYDVYGNLVQQVVTTQSGTTTTRYAIDQNGNAWADLDGSNTLEMRRLYLDGPNQVYARIAADGTLAGYFTDHLNSVRDIVDASGNVLDAKTYDAWGNITSESNSSAGDRFSWAGLVFDMTTGLYGTTHRYYDPAMGRWIEVDQTYFSAGSSNLYEYVGNGPTNATDPSGLITWGVDTENHTLTMKVEVRFVFNDSETSKWTDSRKESFTKSFVKAVEDAYNGTRFHFFPSKKTYIRKKYYSAGPGGYGYIESTQEIPGAAEGWIPKLSIIVKNTLCNDFRIDVESNPSPSRFIKSYVDDDRAYLDEDDVNMSGSVSGNQIPAVHEFGHLLGLKHPGQYLSPPAKPNSPEDYAADARALMGSGMTMRASYYQKWVDWLQKYYDGSGAWEIRPV